MSKEKILQRYQLICTSEYEQLKEEALSYIVGMSNSPIDKESLRGMLLLINFFESWRDDYETMLARRKEE
jgi:hypothetical protein